ncbi:MAG: hypothetical protein CVU62_13365 [Deltaproteobacteria bacterium HGW-Deltaproteobacteria-2]|nr:MAG: hypothetical protein CVU62_13365 [Deltaproteobacteria bacterium HGW-Deltaproteobacteria-2]
MKPNKLRLKGFTGILKGLGLPEIEIDFSEVTGLVALAGDNGRGKSTVLENMTPYNTLASRSGALFNHVYTRDAEKEYSFTYKGNHYRTLLKIDCHSGKSEGFIYKNGSTKSETTSKIREYNKYISDLLGSEAMFFNSVFCAQNSKKLSDMTEGEFKGLLVEFLNLDKLAGWETASKENITAVSGQLEQVDKQILILNNKLAGYEDLKAKLDSYKENYADNEISIDALKKKRVEYQAELESLRDKKSKQEVLIAQKANIEAKITELNNTLAKEQEISDGELNALRDAYKELQGKIKENEALLTQADEINSAAEREREIQGKIDLLSGQIDGYVSALSGNQKCLDEITADLSCIQGGINDCEKDIVKWKNNHEATALQNSFDQALKQSEILEKRDPSCQSSTCSFIVAALKAKEELPGLGSALGKKINEVSDNLSWLNDLLASLKDERITLEEKTTNAKIEINRINGLSGDARKDVARLRLELTKVKDLAGKKTALAVAQSQYESVTKQMEENATKGKELKVKWENRKSDLDGSIADATAALSEITIDNEVDNHIAQVKNATLHIDEEIRQYENDLNNTRATIMKLETELLSMAEVEKDIHAATAEKIALQHDISDWTYLKNACGKNGLQAMEIDGSAPIITNFANDLLTQAFGPIFTVKFRTINDEGKECLDIIIINGDGEEVLLDNLSGGQKVWNLIALRQGMTLLSAEKSGKAFETFMADELDGPLDPENAVNFISMYRAFMKFGNFSDGYFISHKPECRSLADHVLMFEAGKNPVWN